MWELAAVEMTWGPKEKGDGDFRVKKGSEARGGANWPWGPGTHRRPSKPEHGGGVSRVKGSDTRGRDNWPFGGSRDPQTVEQPGTKGIGGTGESVCEDSEIALPLLQGVSPYADQTEVEVAREDSEIALPLLQVYHRMPN